MVKCGLSYFKILELEHLFVILSSIMLLDIQFDAMRNYIYMNAEVLKDFEVREIGIDSSEETYERK